MLARILKFVFEIYYFLILIKKISISCCVTELPFKSNRISSSEILRGAREFGAVWYTVLIALYSVSNRAAITSRPGVIGQTYRTCTVLVHCNVLCCTGYCTVLQEAYCTEKYCFALYSTVMYCTLHGVLKHFSLIQTNFSGIAQTSSRDGGRHSDPREPWDLRATCSSHRLPT